MKDEIDALETLLEEQACNEEFEEAAETQSKIEETSEKLQELHGAISAAKAQQEEFTAKLSCLKRRCQW